jgi:poly-beta-1,6-N-acetyl-D-glucosamine synthase
MRIPHKDAWDVVLAACLLPQELFAWMREAWFCTSWIEVLVSRVTGRRRDHWSMQFAPPRQHSPVNRTRRVSRRRSG